MKHGALSKKHELKVDELESESAPDEETLDEFMRAIFRESQSRLSEDSFQTELLDIHRHEVHLEREDRCDHEDQCERKEKLEHQIEQQILKKS